MFSHNLYPIQWRINTLTPIHKKGNRLATENYRGIAVGSNLSKLFCSILHSRLTTFIEHNKLIPPNQIGYKKGARTSDHIFTLKTLIDKYLNKTPRSYLFTCFVDFKSAFDTVWRKALFYKILNLNVGGLFLKMLESIYSEVYYCVKIGNKITDNIKSNIGVKQGCVLSPTLFNLFLSDLPNIFDESCNPVNILNSKQNCLMFADDIVLLSETPTGLQNCLNKIENYCTTWNLTVNINKTKVIIFNKGGHSFKKYSFTYGTEVVEITQSYCYLGIWFSSCGSFNLAIKHIYDKALKAFFKLKQFDTRECPKLTMKLFNSLVLPIASYGCEVWGPYFIKNLTQDNYMPLCDNLVVEKLNIKLCKYLLGVNKYSTNAAVKGELGRYPLMVKFLNHSLKYWFRMHSPDNHSSFYKMSYIDSLCWSTNSSISWCTYISKLMKFLDLDEVWENQGCFTKGVDSVSILINLHTMYYVAWLNHISNEKSPNKLLNYSTYKHSFKIENYILSIPLKERRNFTKLRISAHTLEIEKGRHTKPKTPVENRLCRFCPAQCIETEKHFLLDCIAYDKERLQLIESLKDISTINIYDDDDVAYTYLMSCLNGDTEIAKIICEFINNSFEKRNSLNELLSSCKSNTVPFVLEVMRLLAINL